MELRSEEHLRQTQLEGEADIIQKEGLHGQRPEAGREHEVWAEGGPYGLRGRRTGDKHRGEEVVAAPKAMAVRGQGAWVRPASTIAFVL